MGAEQSSPKGNLRGYQIVWVLPNSPAEKARLSPFFDFIVSVDQVDLSDNGMLKPNFFVEYIQKTVNQPVRLGVFSTKTCDFREVNLVPRNDWGGDGLLGCSIRYQQVSKSIDFVWHILDVEQNSPSQIIGLESFTDFIVGCQRNLFETPDDFDNFLRDTLRNHESLLMMVYSTKSESFREVLLTPNLRAVMRHGSLGCDIGTGYIHQIPPTVKGRAFVSCQMLTHAQIQEEQARQVDISNRLVQEYQNLLQQQQQQQQQEFRPIITPATQQQQQSTLSPKLEPSSLAGTTTTTTGNPRKPPQHDYNSIDHAEIVIPSTIGSAGKAAAGSPSLPIADSTTNQIIHKVASEISALPEQQQQQSPQPNGNTTAAQQPTENTNGNGGDIADEQSNILSYIENQLEHSEENDSPLYPTNQT